MANYIFKAVQLKKLWPIAVCQPFYDGLHGRLLERSELDIQNFDLVELLGWK